MISQIPQIPRNGSTSPRFIAVIRMMTIGIALLFVLFGCSDRESEESLEFQEASNALSKAEEALKKAGLGFSFRDVATLGPEKITEILPDPLAIGALQRENPEVLKDAVRSFYNVLNALPKEAVSVPASPPLAPFSKPPQISKNDVALVHLHLGYLYLISTVGKLNIEGMGLDGKFNTPDDLFLVELSKEARAKGYKFRLSDEALARFEEIEKLPNVQPEDFLKEFSESQRQAVLDALDLLFGAKVRILPNPAFGVRGQKPNIDRSLYRRDLLFHLEIAVSRAREVAPNLEEAFAEFNRVIVELFAEDFLVKSEKWGFKVENKAEVEIRLKKLLAKAQ